MSAVLQGLLPLPWPDRAARPALCADNGGVRDRSSDAEAAREGTGLPAFEQIVFQHRTRVFRVALSVLGPGCEADAEDVAQEAFVRFHRSLATFRGEAAVGTWLYRTAFNLAVDHRRRRSRRPAEAAANAVAGEDALAALPAPGEGPYETARGGERSRLVAGLLRSLPESHRAALRLHYWMGHTVGEIAELLGVAPGTVKSWLHRGRERLREELEGLGEAP